MRRVRRSKTFPSFCHFARVRIPRVEIITVSMIPVAGFIIRFLWRFGICRRFTLRFEWLTWLPVSGVFPVSLQIFDIKIVRGKCTGFLIFRQGSGKREHPRSFETGVRDVGSEPLDQNGCVTVEVPAIVVRCVSKGHHCVFTSRNQDGYVVVWHGARSCGKQDSK